jgi:hypothetical protein
LTLLADIVIYTPGSGLNSVDFGPGATVPVLDTSAIGTDAASQIISTYVPGGFPFAIPEVLFSASSPASDQAFSPAISVTIDSTGSPIAVDLMMGNVAIEIATGVTAWDASITVYRDAAAISTCPTQGWDSVSEPNNVGLTANYTGGFTFVDTPAAGSHVYSVVASGGATGGGSSSSSIALHKTSMKVREIKR